MSPSEPKNDPATIDALKAATGFDAVRTPVGETADGQVRYAEGYRVSPGSNEHVFFNEVGQSVHVPPHRVADELAKAAPAEKKADPRKAEGK